MPPDALTHGAPRDRAGRASWAGRTLAACRFGLRGDAATLGLAGFLLRGGLVVLALPVLVLPSPVGIASTFGLEALTIAAQPTSWLVEVVGLATLLLAGWLVVAGLAGAIVDAWLVALALEEAPAANVATSDVIWGGRAAAPLAPPRRGTVLRLVAVRAAFLVPLLLALALAGVLVANAIQAELLTPTDLATSLTLRVVSDSAAGLAVLGVVWLVTETLAALAVRRVSLDGAAVPEAVFGAILEAIRHPVSTGLTGLGAVAASAVAVGLPLLGAALAFDSSRIAARDGDPAGLAFASCALALSWLAALGLAGIASAARSAAFSYEVAAAIAADRGRVRAGS